MANDGSVLGAAHTHPTGPALDGAERVSSLAMARLVMVSPSNREGAPVHVAIKWAPGVWEQPVPGSSLWHTVLEQRLAALDPSVPDQRILGGQIRQSRARFPDLESWWAWVRSGWTRPPAPDPQRRRWWHQW